MTIAAKGESRAMLRNLAGKRAGTDAVVPDRPRITATFNDLVCHLLPSPAAAMTPRWALSSPLPAEPKPRGNTLRFDAGGPRWPREPAEPVRPPASPEAVFWGRAAVVLVIAALLLPFSLAALIDLWRYMLR